MEAIQRLGKAQVGDKTMLDAFVPFVEVLSKAVSSGQDLSESWSSSTDAADTAAVATAGLRPRIGRARPLAERSVGTPDAGAVSFVLCVGAVGGVLKETR
jgi:D-erythrulose 4-kinase